MIELTVNGETLRLEQPLTVTQLLARYDLQPKRVVVELNREILPRERYETTTLGDGDGLEIVQMMAGG